MAQWIKTDGTTVIVVPKNGSDFQLDELKEFIGGGYIELIGLPPNKLMVLDEEGKLKQFPYNSVATKLARPVLQPGDFIVGPVLVCKRGELK